jgi:hypothetical protein
MFAQDVPWKVLVHCASNGSPAPLDYTQDAMREAPVSRAKKVSLSKVRLDHAHATARAAVKQRDA